jgi:hypothetical protein
MVMAIAGQTARTEFARYSALPRSHNVARYGQYAKAGLYPAFFFWKLNGDLATEHVFAGQNTLERFSVNMKLETKVMTVAAVALRFLISRCCRKFASSRPPPPTR